MGEIYWALGSMLIVMLVVYFLPLGFTKKGKVVLVGISFVLALGGIAATASFSFLITTLILVVLIFFVTYLMDQRLGKLLLIKDNAAEEEMGNEDSALNSAMQTAASHERVYQNKNEAHIEPINLLKGKNQNRSDASKNSESDIPAFEPENEDVTFLLNRTIEMEEEAKKKQEEPKLNEGDYLSEIEELLENEFDDPQTIEPIKPSGETNSRDNEHEIPVISFEEKPKKKNIESDVKVNDSDEIPILPFHEKEDVKS